MLKTVCQGAMVRSNQRVTGLLCVLVALVGLCGVTSAQQPAPQPAAPPATAPTTLPAGPSGPVARYIEPAVPIIVRVDMSQVNVQAATRWMADIVAAIEPDPAVRDSDVTGIHDTMTRVGTFVQGFTGAGGREMYVMLAMMRGQPSPLAFLVPADPATAATVQQQLQTLGNPNAQGGQRAQLLDGVIAVAPQQLLARWQQGVPDLSNAVKLNEALERTAGAPLQAVLMTGPNTQPLLHSLVMLVPQLTGVPAATQPADPAASGPAADLQQLPQDIRWIALAMQPPPQESLQIVVQANDAQAAQRVQAALKHLLEKMRESPGQLRNIDRVVAGLTPQLQEDRLLVQLDATQLSALLKEDVGPLLGSSRAAGRRAQSAGQMQRIRQAIGFYAGSHGQRLPAELGVLVTELGANVALLKNPQQPSRDVGYIYVRPGPTIPQVTGPAAQGHQLVLLYEAYDQWPGGVNVGFVDGRVEYVQDEATLKQLIEQTKAFAAQLEGAAPIGPLPASAPAGGAPAPAR